MSVVYGIDVTLKSFYSEKNIYLIIEKGYKLGFIYFDHIWGERYADSPILSIQDAVKKIMDRSPEILENGGPSIYTKLEDTYFFFQINSNFDRNLEISIGGFASEWKKEFWNSPSGDTLMIDFARYIRLMLKLCEDFTILKLETSAD